MEPIESPTRRRPHFRLSVRAMMGLVLVLAVAMGLYVRSVHIQQDAVAAIRKAGGSVDYDWRWGNYNPDILDNDGKWRAPRWLARIVPVDYVANVVYVSLIPRKRNDPKRADDATLSHVGRLRHVTYLRLTDTAITDAGMVHFKNLTHLRDLQLDRTRVGDAGLAHLRGLKGLRMVWISGTRVTDDGVLDLERELPDVYVLRLEELASSDHIPKAMADLEYARKQPVRLAAALLVDRARTLAMRNELQSFIATVDALCDLEAEDPISLVRLAEARAKVIGHLEPERTPRLSPAERTRLQKRCADRGMAALSQAVELGYDNVHRLEGDSFRGLILRNLCSHPEFPELIERMKAMNAGR